MDRGDLRNLLEKPLAGGIGVLGDFCVDVYWEIHPELGERSIETGLTTTPVAKARYSPGGAGNIVSNLRGIGVAHPFCFGALGRDPFGLWLRHDLTGGLAEYDRPLLDVPRADYQTPTYCKPLKDGVEQSRIDLGNTPVTDAEAEALMARIEEYGPKLKVLIVNEQIFHGIHTPHFRTLFADYVKRNPHHLQFVYDGRDFLDAYPGVTLKINASAASHVAFGEDGHAPEESGRTILKRTGFPLVVTDGERGCYTFEPSGVRHLDAILYNGPVDTVGAGDSFAAGFAYALAKNATLTDAAAFGTCCSAVTVRKLNQTGAPSPEELLSL